MGEEGRRRGKEKKKINNQSLVYFSKNVFYSILLSSKLFNLVSNYNSPIF